MEEPDSVSVVSTAEVSTAVPESEGAMSTAVSEQGPDPVDLLRRFGRKLPQEEHAGMQAWMKKRLKKIKGELADSLDISLSDKEVWVAAKQKWMALSQEKKEL